VSGKVIFATALVVLLSVPAYGQESELKWEKTYAAAMTKAKETGKLVFADFTSEIN
jgi:hypothetical protein